MKKNILTLFAGLISFWNLGQDFTVDRTRIETELVSGDKATFELELTNLSANTLELTITSDRFTSGSNSVTFSKADYAVYDLPQNVDKITNHVWITRADERGIFNLAQESEFGFESPRDTEWSWGSTSDASSESYVSWAQAINGSPPNMVGQALSMHLITDDQYYDVIFNEWTSGGQGGGFSYTRTRVFEWIEIEEEISLAGNTMQTVLLTVHADGLPTGTYADTLVFQSEFASHEIALQVKVEDAPGIALDAVQLDFGNILVGDSSSQVIEIANVGTQTLEGAMQYTGDSEFLLNADLINLGPGEKEAFAITFRPGRVEIFSGEVRIQTNDPSDSVLVLPLTGRGVEPAEAAVVADTLRIEMFSGDNLLSSFQVNNQSHYPIPVDFFLTSEGGSLGTVTFTKEDFADPTLPEAQDRISPNVWITRANDRGLYNSKVESSYGQGSPVDTEWAFGHSEELSPADYMPWVIAVQGSPPQMVDRPMSLHLISEDRYYDIIFHSWTGGGNGGGFSYTRTSNYDWIQLEETLVLDSASVTIIPFEIDAAGFDAGTYYAAIHLTFNQDTLIQPLELQIIEAAGLHPELDTIRFGEVFLGQQVLHPLKLTNVGVSDLLITGISISDTKFTISPRVAGIDPGDSETFIVGFSPEEVMDYEASITFTSNDPSDQAFTLVVEGNGVEPPQVGVNKNMINATLTTGNMSDELVSVTNSGLSNLEFNIETELVSGSSGPWVLIQEDEDNLPYTPDIKAIYVQTDAESFRWKIVTYEPINPYEFYFPIIIDADRNTRTGIDYQNSYEVAIGAEYTMWYNGQQLDVWDDTNEIIAKGTVDFDNSGLAFVIEVNREDLDIPSSFDFAVLAEDLIRHYQANGPAHFDINPSWLQVNPKGGIIEVDQSRDLQISLDAAHLFGGTYEARVLVHSNDPLTPVYPIDIRLDVTGIPLYAGPETIDFGEIYADIPTTRTVELTNAGTEDLILSGITSTSDQLVVEQTEQVIPPLTTAAIDLTIYQENPGAFSSSFSFTTNDSSHPSIEIPVSATVIDPPSIGLSISQINERIDRNSDIAHTVEVTNLGAGNLEFVVPEFPQAALDLTKEDSWVEIPYWETFTPAAGVTVSMWLMLKEDPSCDANNNWRQILNRTFAAVSGAGFDIVLEEDRSITWSVGTEGGLSRYNGGVIPLDEWINLTCTYEAASGTLYIYLNGVEVAGALEGNGSGRINENYSPLQLSTYVTGCPSGFGPFPGLLYDFRFWDHALSADEVAKSMRRPLAGAEPGLIMNQDFGLEGYNFQDRSPQAYEGYMGVNTSRTFKTPFSWITYSGISGTLGPEANKSFDVKLSGIEGGVYDAEIGIVSNDPIHPIKAIPVQLSVVLGAQDKQGALPGQNYPNPFVEETAIPYQISESGEVAVIVWNSDGRVVLNKTIRQPVPGQYEMRWRPGYLSTGIYYYRILDLNGNDDPITYKMIYGR